MIFSSKDQELRVRLAAKQLPFPQYKLLAEWLDVYTYILPDQRAKPAYIEELFKLYLWLRDVESTLSTVDQQCLTQLTQELGTSPIPLYSLSIVAQENFNCINLDISQTLGLSE